MIYFFDIDDTLVLWDDDATAIHPMGDGARGWKWNQPLVDFIINVGHTFVLWSGGGKDYARTWRDRLISDYPELEADIRRLGHMALDLDPRIAIDGDICVDDQAEFRGVNSPATWLTPEDFIATI